MCGDIRFLCVYGCDGKGMFLMERVCCACVHMGEGGGEVRLEPLLDSLRLAQ